MVALGWVVLGEHLEHGVLINELISLGLADDVLGPTVQFVACQPVANRHREAQFAAVEHVLRNNLLHGATQCVLGGAVRNTHVHRQRLCNVEDHTVEERHAQLQGVGHGDLVGLDQNVATQPGEQIQVLHPSHRVPAFRLRVNRCRDIAVVPFLLGPRQDFLQLLKVKGTSIAVVALLQRSSASLQQRLAAHAFWQSFADLSQTAQQGRGNLVERFQRQRLLINGVTTKELVCALTGQYDLNVLTSLCGHEVQRHQCRVSYRVIEVPHNLRNRPGELLRRDDLHNVLDANGGGGLGSHIDLGEALALEAGGKRQQVRVVALSQSCNRSGVDTARQERAHRDVGTHMLLDAVLQRTGNAVKNVLLSALSHWLNREIWLEVAGLLNFATRRNDGSATRLQTNNVGVQRLRLRHVLQIDVVLQCALIQLLRIDAHLRRGLEQGLLLRTENRAALGGGVVERLNAERIARQEKLALDAVPNGNAEHAAQVLYDVRSPVVEPNDDRFTIAGGIKGIAFLLQLLAKFDEIVDFAVEGHGVTIRLILWSPLQRLVAVGNINNG